MSWIQGYKTRNQAISKLTNWMAGFLWDPVFMEKRWRMEGSLAYPRYPAGRTNFSYISLLRFSKTRELWSSNAAFAVAFYAAVNHNYDHKQQTLKHWNTQNGSNSTNHTSPTMTFWTRWSKLLFPKRSAKMIDGSEERKRQLAVKDAAAVYMRNKKAGSARVTLPAGLAFLHINTMPRTAGSTRSRHDNHSMRDLRWLDREGEPSTQDRFSYNRGLRDTII